MKHSTRLSLLVFLAGTGAMATEIAASRLLAPYYGASTVVWANIIGLILASLAVGYWVGGRIADRRPDPVLLGRIVLASAALIAVVPFAARPFLDISVRGIDTVSAGAVIGSFVAALLLFAPPVVLLGMVSPFALRLSVTGVEAAGAVSGRLYALSTAGSLLGTFASALITIPLLGTQRTLLLAAATVALAGALLLPRRWLLAPAALVLLMVLPPGVVKPQAGLIEERESRYQFIQVVARGSTRLLYLNEGQAVHSVYRPDTVFTGGEWDMFLTLPSLLGRPVSTVAILGSAGGTTARAYGELFPQARVDCVEIDPEVSAVGREYFGLGDNPGAVVTTADARPFLRASKQQYDLILIDAYRQPYVPFYLATREFFALARERLAPGGIVALNVTTLPGDTRLADGVGGTLATEFPQVISWQALRFNQLVVGLSSPAAADELQARLRSASPASVTPLTTLFADHLQPVDAAAHPWTDDRAPVEWITDRMIVDYAARGEDQSEEPLPTAP
jgi:spermidine synthase